MKELLWTLPHTFIPLFVAMDVFWLLPIFTGATAGFDPGRRNRLITQSIATALVVSLLFTLVGEVIFRTLGITVDDFKVAGGLLLLVLAILDLTTSGSRGALLPPEAGGVVPLGVPLIVGPAVLTTIIVLVDHYGPVPTVSGLVLNLAVLWFSLRWSRGLVRVLGEDGIAALSKVMAILLASIAVMMIRLGILGLLESTPR